MRRLSYLLPAIVGASCVTAPGEQERALELRAEPVWMPYRLFPELGPVDTSYRWFGGAVPADRTAPVCEVASPPTEYRVERVATRGRFVEALEVALPSTLAGRPETHFIEDDSAEARGGILVASWHEAVPPSPAEQRQGLNVAVWVGPEDGYPTIGADTASVQLFARQCRLRTNGDERFVVEFALRHPLGTDEYLGAFWRVASDRYVRVMITGYDVTRRPDARTIVGSMRAIPRQ